MDALPLAQLTHLTSGVSRAMTSVKAARRGSRRARSFACSMAYQPIVDVVEGRTIAYEALARGLRNEPASTVLGESGEVDGDRFVEQQCGMLAVEMAALLGITAMGLDLYVNSSPNGPLLDVAGLRSSIEAAASAGLPLERLILEITEGEPLRDPGELRRTLEPFRARGLRTAIDDFGAGFAGLSTLAAFQPEIVKIDIELVKWIDRERPKRVIVRHIVGMCADLGIGVIAEGVESREQTDTLLALGVRFMQGNWFAEPGFERLPAWPQ